MAPKKKPQRVVEKADSYHLSSKSLMYKARVTVNDNPYGVKMHETPLRVWDQYKQIGVDPNRIREFLDASKAK